MDLLRTRQVDPVHQSPQMRMYGFFTHGTVPPSRLYSSGFLSRPDHLRRLAFPDPIPSPVARSRDFHHASGVRFLRPARLRTPLLGYGAPHLSARGTSTLPEQRATQRALPVCRQSESYPVVARIDLPTRHFSGYL